MPLLTYFGKCPIQKTLELFWPPVPLHLPNANDENLAFFGFAYEEPSQTTHSAVDRAKTHYSQLELVGLWR